jgi:hypothetical protein
MSLHVPRPDARVFILGAGDELSGYGVLVVTVWLWRSGYGGLVVTAWL